MSSKLLPSNDLGRAAKRAASHSSALVAGLTAAWEHAFPEDPLEDMLGCSVEAVTELSLCLRPRSDTWTADVVEIAEAIGVEPARLESFFRKAEVAERFSLAHSSDDAIEGRLLAARDREEDK